MMSLFYEAFCYQLPLTAPLRIGNQLLSARRGLVIRCTDDDGCYGYGEVAPLPGLHKENVTTNLAQFVIIREALRQQKLPDALAHLQGGFNQWFGHYNLCPTLRHGLEMATLNLLACRRQCTLAALLNPFYQHVLPVNGLLVEPKRLAVQARRLLRQGYTTIKLKVGRQSLAEDIAMVRLARQILGAAVKLRLDANRSWNFMSAVQFGNAVRDCNIEYIEEPLTDPQQWSDFYKTTAIPVALDESLSDWNIETLEIPEGVGAFILKPAVLGGIETTMQFIRLARRHCIQAVISSAFESGVGLAALANYAAALTGGHVPAGLDTYRWFRADLPVKRFTTPGGKVAVDSVYYQAKLLRSQGLKQVI
jgi:o-succinylbenzoate synthase